MDADAYLRRQGWKGSGHSLDHRGQGIKKPLLIAHKQDQLGLGQKKAAHRVDDQWWMRAFDESLQNIGTGQESTLSQVRKQGINRGGLYGFFVRGEGLIGTISNTDESSAAGTENSSEAGSGVSTPITSAEESDVKKSKKRKRGDDKDDQKERTATVEKTKSKSKRTIEKNNKDAKTDPTKVAKDVRAASKTEKKERKRAAQAGLTLEAYRAQSDITAHQVAIATKLAKLDKAELKQYTKRAASKGVSLEQYVLRRIQKKDSKSAP